jgi:ketosteroid isomerase-like protein
MSGQANIDIAQTFLAGIGSGQDASEMASAFAEDLVFEIQGDEGAMPWIGRKIGRQALTEFLRELRDLTEPLSFNVDDILANDERAVIIGSLRTRINETGKVVATQFVIVLTVSNGVVTRFQMLEDSFALSKAARPHQTAD